MRIESYPSYEFYQHTGIEGLYTEWTIPNEVLENNNFIIDGRYLCRKPITSKVVNLIEASYTLIVDSNKDLGSIKVSSYIDKHSVVYGAISKFNYNDIKLFTENYDDILKYNIECRDKYILIETLYGIWPQWVMSPETLKLIL